MGAPPEAPLDPTVSSSPRGLAGLLLHSTSQAGRAVGQLNGASPLQIHSQASSISRAPHTGLKKHQKAVNPPLCLNRLPSPLASRSTLLGMAISWELVRKDDRRV